MARVFAARQDLSGHMRVVEQLPSGYEIVMLFQNCLNCKEQSGCVMGSKSVLVAGTICKNRDKQMPFIVRVSG